MHSHWSMPTIEEDTPLQGNPYFLLFGRTPCLPIDVSVGVTCDNGVTQPYTVYADNLCTLPQYAHDLAVQNAWRKVESNKKRFDIHTSPGVLLPSDCVLVTNLRPQGKTKQKDQREDSYTLWQAVLETYLSMWYSKKAPEWSPPYITTCSFFITTHTRPYTLLLQQALTQHQVPIAVATRKPSDWLMPTLMEVTESWSPLLSSPQRKSFLTLVLCPFPCC